MVLAAAFLCAVNVAAHAEWFVDADAGAIFDSNLTGAASGPDIRSDWAAALDASIGHFFALSGDDGLTLAVNVRGEVYNRFQGLNLAAIGASARYRHKFGLGRDVPSVSFVVNSLYGDYRDSVRTGARFDLRAEFAMRFSEADRRFRRCRLRPALRSARSGDRAGLFGRGLQPHGPERVRHR